MSKRKTKKLSGTRNGKRVPKKKDGRATRENKGGRPLMDVQVPIEEYVKEMGAWGCTKKEVYTKLGISESTFLRRYDGFYLSGRNELKLTLRKAQILNATKKMNSTMQIFLGKQYLNQKDSPDLPDEESEKEFIRYSTEWGGSFAFEESN